MSASESICDYWKVDAATYDQAASHNPETPIELAAWRGALSRLLSPPPARVLDVGATGTRRIRSLDTHPPHCCRVKSLTEQSHRYGQGGPLPPSWAPYRIRARARSWARTAA